MYSLPYSVGPKHQAMSTNDQEGRNNQTGQLSNGAGIAGKDSDADVLGDKCFHSVVDEAPFPGNWSRCVSLGL